MLTDTAVLVERNLLTVKRIPTLLISATIQPLMFVFLFAYVFGAAINIPGVNYKEFLLPGIMGQTIVFTAFIVSTGITADLSTPSQLALCLLMYLGRIGPVTFAVAINARRTNKSLIDYPPERDILVG